MYLLLTILCEAVGVILRFFNNIKLQCITHVFAARQGLSHQAQPSVAQPHYKSVSASLSTPSVPLQSQSQGGTLLLGGNCNILSSGTVLSVEGFGGRAAQQSDRSCILPFFGYFWIKSILHFTKKSLFSSLC